VTLIPVRSWWASRCPRSVFCLPAQRSAADLTVKAPASSGTGSYSYPDNGKFEFDSLLVRVREKLSPTSRGSGRRQRDGGAVNKTVRVLTTGAEVIHSFACLVRHQIDAIPAASTRPGSRPRAKASITANAPKLCGKDHAFMPIAVRW